MESISSDFSLFDDLEEGEIPDDLPNFGFHRDLSISHKAFQFYSARNAHSIGSSRKDSPLRKPSANVSRNGHSKRNEFPAKDLRSDPKRSRRDHESKSAKASCPEGRKAQPLKSVHATDFSQSRRTWIRRRARQIEKQHKRDRLLQSGSSAPSCVGAAVPPTSFGELWVQAQLRRTAKSFSSDSSGCSPPAALSSTSTTTEHAEPPNDNDEIKVLEAPSRPSPPVITLDEEDSSSEELQQQTTVAVAQSAVNGDSAPAEVTNAANAETGTATEVMQQQAAPTPPTRADDKASAPAADVVEVVELVGAAALVETASSVDDEATGEVSEDAENSDVAGHLEALADADDEELELRLMALRSLLIEPSMSSGGPSGDAPDQISATNDALSNCKGKERQNSVTAKSKAVDPIASRKQLLCVRHLARRASLEKPFRRPSRLVPERKTSKVAPSTRSSSKPASVVSPMSEVFKEISHADQFRAFMKAVTAPRKPGSTASSRGRRPSKDHGSQKATSPRGSSPPKVTETEPCPPAHPPPPSVLGPPPPPLPLDPPPMPYAILGPPYHGTADVGHRLIQPSLTAIVGTLALAVAAPPPPPPPPLVNTSSSVRKVLLPTPRNITRKLSEGADDEDEDVLRAQLLISMTKPASGSQLRSSSASTSSGNAQSVTVHVRQSQSSNSGNSLLAGGSKNNPPLVVSSKANPPTAVSSKGNSPTAVGSKGDPPTAVGSKGDPPTAVSSKGNPSTAVSSKGNPPTAVSSKGNPPTAVSSKGNPPTAVVSKGNPPTAVSSKHNCSQRSGKSAGIKPVVKKVTDKASSVNQVAKGSASASSSMNPSAASSEPPTKRFIINMQSDSEESEDELFAQALDSCRSNFMGKLDTFLQQARDESAIALQTAPVCAAAAVDAAGSSSRGSDTADKQMAAATTDSTRSDTTGGVSQVTSASVDSVNATAAVGASAVRAASTAAGVAKPTLRLDVRRNRQRTRSKSAKQLDKSPVRAVAKHARMKSVKRKLPSPTSSHSKDPIHLLPQSRVAEYVRLKKLIEEKEMARRKRASTAKCLTLSSKRVATPGNEAKTNRLRQSSSNIIRHGSLLKVKHPAIAVNSEVASQLCGSEAEQVKISGPVNVLPSVVSVDENAPSAGLKSVNDQTKKVTNDSTIGSSPNKPDNQVQASQPNNTRVRAAGDVEGIAVGPAGFLLREVLTATASGRGGRTSAGDAKDTASVADDIDGDVKAVLSSLLVPFDDTSSPLATAPETPVQPSRAASRQVTAIGEDGHPDQISHSNLHSSGAASVSVCSEIHAPVLRITVRTPGVDSKDNASSQSLGSSPGDRCVIQYTSTAAADGNVVAVPEDVCADRTLDVGDPPALFTCRLPPLEDACPLVASRSLAVTEPNSDVTTAAESSPMDVTTEALDEDDDVEHMKKLLVVQQLKSTEKKLTTVRAEMASEIRQSLELRRQLLSEQLVVANVSASVHQLRQLLAAAEHKLAARTDHCQQLRQQLVGVNARLKPSRSQLQLLSDQCRRLGSELFGHQYVLPVEGLPEESDGREDRVPDAAARGGDGAEVVLGLESMVKSTECSSALPQVEDSVLQKQVIQASDGQSVEVGAKHVGSISSDRTSEKPIQPSSARTSSETAEAICSSSGTPAVSLAVKEQPRLARQIGTRSSPAKGALLPTPAPPPTPATSTAGSGDSVAVHNARRQFRLPLGAATASTSSRPAQFRSLAEIVDPPTDMAEVQWSSVLERFNRLVDECEDQADPLPTSRFAPYKSLHAGKPATRSARRCSPGSSTSTLCRYDLLGRCNLRRCPDVHLPAPQGTVKPPPAAAAVTAPETRRTTRLRTSTRSRPGT